MANYKKPSWFIDIRLQHVSGQFRKPSWFQDKTLSKPTGEPNLGGFQEAQVTKYGGKFNAGGYQEPQNLKVPTGAFNKGAFQDQTGYVDPDPYGNYYFALEISDGQNQNATTVAHFQECSGLKNSTTPFEIEEGGTNNKAHKRAGQGKWENIVLKYATSGSVFLLTWRDDWVNGVDNWKNRTKWSGAVTLKNNAGDVIKRYSFKNAWPVSWEGPAFSSGDSSLAVETLELAHDGLTIEDS
jgi:phage tail-like protein